MPEQQIESQQHESQEPNLRGLLIAGIVIAAAIVIAVGLSLGLMALFGGFGRPLARAQHQAMPEPHLQPHPLSDRARYEQRQRTKLSGYHWVDHSAGIVRIPIGRAMRILAEQHQRAAADAPAPARAARPAPSSRRPHER